MGGDVSTWTDDKKGAFERATERILNAEVRVLRVTAASVLISFVAYARTGVYTDALSVAGKLRDATVVRRLKEALAQETGFAVESDPRVTKTIVFTLSPSGEISGRVVFARTGAIVGGVLGGFVGVVLLTILPVLVIRRFRHRRLAAKGRSPASVAGLPVVVVATGRV